MNSQSNNNDLLGPGTDLIISLLAVLLMSIAINGKIQENEQAYILKIKEHQENVIEEIIEEFPGCTVEIDIDSINYYIDTDIDGIHDIHVFNDVTLQKISFGEQILFASGSDRLKKEGKDIIGKFQNAIVTNLNYIEEISIQGHADIRGGDNYQLGFDRALEVRNNLKLSSVSNLISIKSFGKYKPVGREDKDTNFTLKKLGDLNLTEESKRRNRRTDVVLNYRENYQPQE